jgi:hypothetical protein
MSIKNEFSTHAGQFFFLLWLIITAGCTPAIDETILADVTESTIIATPTIEPIPADVTEVTATSTATIGATAMPESTPTPTVIPTPTLPSNAVTTLPVEIKFVMDPEVCPRACYLNLTPGQTKDEALAILQTLEVVDIEIDDEEDFDGLTGIDWQWKDRLLPFILRNDGNIAFRDGHSVFFGAAPRDLVPISLILEEYGEPDYMDVGGDDTGQWYFRLIYLHQDTIVKFDAWGFGLSKPTALSANTLLQYIGIEEMESFFNWVCEGGWEIKFQEWKGYGGLGVYYDQYGNRLDEVSIVDCADYEQPDPDDE